MNQQTNVGGGNPPSTGTIAEWCKYINEWAQEKGWNDVPLKIGDIISNLHSEITEAWEEVRNGHNVTEVYNKCPTCSTINCHHSATYGGSHDRLKPEGFPIEIADLVIRVFHVAAYYGINLEEMIAIKMGYNKTRPYRHGGKKA